MQKIFCTLISTAALIQVESDFEPIDAHWIATIAGNRHRTIYNKQYGRLPINQLNRNHSNDPV